MSEQRIPLAGVIGTPIEHSRSPGFARALAEAVWHSRALHPDEHIPRQSGRHDPGFAAHGVCGCKRDDPP